MAIIGFIGLGNMGGPMAANLVKAGHTVTGFDLNPASLEALAAAGGAVAASASDAVKGAEVVITMLPAGQHVRQVWLHQGGLIDVVKDSKPLLIDCSTIDVESARVVTAAAEEAGMTMLDVVSLWLGQFSKKNDKYTDEYIEKLGADASRIMDDIEREHDERTQMVFEDQRPEPEGEQVLAVEVE